MSNNRKNYSMFDDYLEEIKETLPKLKSVKLTLQELNKNHPQLYGEYANFNSYLKRRGLTIEYSRKTKTMENLEKHKKLIKDIIMLENKNLKETYIKLLNIDNTIDISYGSFRKFVLEEILKTYA